MGGTDYLEGLEPAQAERLIRVNEPGLTALRGYLAGGAAVAFLGAGVSRPLYPLWTGLIGELVVSASARMTDEEAATCLMLARESPEEVVEIVRRSLGHGAYREVLLYQGHDAADAALRLATRHHLAWHELDALRAHALLDEAEVIDRGWAAKADALYVRLVPAGLDPDPLGTVERLVVAEREQSED